MGNEILNAISTCRFRGDQDRSVKAWCYDPMEFKFFVVHRKIDYYWLMYRTM
jgi:hypothetical protein